MSTRPNAADDNQFQHRRQTLVIAGATTIVPTVVATAVRGWYEQNRKRQRVEDYGNIFQEGFRAFGRDILQTLRGDSFSKRQTKTLLQLSHSRVFGSDNKELKGCKICSPITQKTFVFGFPVSIKSLAAIQDITDNDGNLLRRCLILDSQGNTLQKCEVRTSEGALLFAQELN